MMIVLNKNFQMIGDFNVCCFPERGDNVLAKCSKYIRSYTSFPQVVYLKCETESEKKWLGSNTEKFYFDGQNIIEIDDDSFL